MIHARYDYQRIQDPSGKIPADEPVFLLRAKDKLAPATVLFWGVLCFIFGGKKLGKKVILWSKRMRDWQKEMEGSRYACKMPDEPGL